MKSLSTIAFKVITLFFVFSICVPAQANQHIYTSNTGIKYFYKKIVNDKVKIFFFDNRINGVGGGNSYCYSEDQNSVFIPYNNILKAYSYYLLVLTREFYQISNIDTNRIVIFSRSPGFGFPFFDAPFEYNAISYDYGLSHTDFALVGNSQSQFKGLTLDPVNDSIIYIASRLEHSVFNSDTTFIYKSYNYGADFITLDTITEPIRVFNDTIFLRINPFDRSELFLNGVNNLFISNDSGRSFYPSNLPSFRNLYFNYVDSSLIGFSYKNLYKRSNGMGWDSIPNAYIERQVINDVEFKDGNVFVGNRGGVYKSTDNGSTFFLFNNSFGSFGKVIGISHLNLTDSLLVCTDSSLFLISDTTILLGIQQISSEVPADFKLHQNYPNPFNPLTKIKYELKTGGSVKMVVFDITGREISVPIAQRQSAGIYELEFSSSEYGKVLSSGIYFYSLFIDNKVIDTKKMMLVK